MTETAGCSWTPLLLLLLHPGLNALSIPLPHAVASDRSDPFATGDHILQHSMIIDGNGNLISELLFLSGLIHFLIMQTDNVERWKCVKKKTLCYGGFLQYIGSLHKLWKNWKWFLLLVGFQPVHSCSIDTFTVKDQWVRSMPYILYLCPVMFQIAFMTDRLCQHPQPRERGRMRFHRLQNVQIALDYLKRRQVIILNNIFCSQTYFDPLC